MIVVEHDEDIMRAADYLIDIGPDAGRLGGEVVWKGHVPTTLKGKSTAAKTTSVLKKSTSEVKFFISEVEKITSEVDAAPTEYGKWGRGVGRI